jgi:serine/threonine-protein kinase RsbW
MWNTLELTSELTSLDTARHWASEQAAAAHCDRETVFAIELALTETLSNVVRHAYEGRPGQPIRIEMAVETDRVQMRVTDWGLPFDVEAFEPMDLDVPREGGYGVHLIRTLMDEINYDTSQPGVTSVELVRKRHPSGATETSPQEDSTPDSPSVDTQPT